MRTSAEQALSFCEDLYAQICLQLSEPSTVRARLEAIGDHAPGFPETLFCKGCVLPIVDFVATRFLSAELSLPSLQIRSALRCEGFASLPNIYLPSAQQSGFSAPPWGSNYQQVSKSGLKAKPGQAGIRPCPDFGIVHTGPPKFTLLGETKFARKATRLTLLLTEITRDLRYYMGLPSEPTKGWDYDFGFGIAYAGGGTTTRQSRFITDHWVDQRFVVAAFHA